MQVPFAPPPHFRLSAQSVPRAEDSAEGRVEKFKTKLRTGSREARSRPEHWDGAVAKTTKKDSDGSPLVVVSLFKHETRGRRDRLSFAAASPRMLLHQRGHVGGAAGTVPGVGRMYCPRAALALSPHHSLFCSSQLSPDLCHLDSFSICSDYVFPHPLSPMTNPTMQADSAHPGSKSSLGVLFLQDRLQGCRRSAPQCRREPHTHLRSSKNQKKNQTMFLAWRSRGADWPRGRCHAGACALVPCSRTD